MNYLYLYLICSFWTCLFFVFRHRYLAHRSITFAPSVLVFIKVVDWLMTTRYSTYYNRKFTARHIKHHITADTEADPHSPVLQRVKDWKEISKEDVYKYTEGNELLDATKLDNFFEKYSYGLYISYALGFFAFGWEGLIYVTIFSWYTVYWSIAHAYTTHMWPGYNLGDLGPIDKARNIPYLNWFFFGEEFHGNHHLYPGKASFALKWYELDFGFYLIKVLEFFKLAKVINNEKITNTTFKWVNKEIPQYK